MKKNIVVVGIYDKGCLLAERIVRELSAIAEGVKISLIKLEINKEKPLCFGGHTGCALQKSERESDHPGR